MVKVIENILYKITYYGSSKFIEAETKKDLFKYIIDEESKGYLITSVTLIEPNGKTPKVAFKTDSEYKALKKKINSNKEVL
jgi:hypothetical protein